MKNIKFSLMLAVLVFITCGLQAAMDQAKINAYTAVNAASPLNLPSYHPSSEGHNEVLHPDVIYIPGGWNGYAYWMAYTPFPNTNANSPLVDPFLNPMYENPHVVASNDGVNWVAPTGLTNPIDLLEVGNNLYNSDTEMLLSPDGLSLYCIWREYSYYAGNTTETVYYRSSTNGISWSGRVQVFAITTTSQVLLSPSIIYKDGKYRMWSVKKGTSGSAKIVEYREANALTGPWSSPVPTDIVPLVYSGATPTRETWHINVIFHNGYYWMINQVGVYNTESGGTIYLGYSADGLHWTFGANPVLNQRNFPNWDWILYRASIVPVDAFSNNFKIWYSTIRKQYRDSAPCKIGYTVTTGGVATLPVASAASAICHNGFTARWNAVEGATSYRLDVLQSDGVTYVSGYQDKPVTGTLARVETLNSSTAYKYRIRAYNNGSSQNSNTIDVSTSASVQGVSASTSILGDPVTISVPNVTGGPAFTNNNLVIDPPNAVSNDYSVSVGWHPTGYNSIPSTRLVVAVSCSDNTALNGVYTINHTGMGFAPSAVRYKYGSILWQTVAHSSTINSTTFTISGLSKASKGELIIALNDGGSTLPVELSSFTAIPTAQNYVRLDWVTQSETNVLGYYIYRGFSDNFSSSQLVSPLITASNTSQGDSYSFTDTEPGGIGVYYYWLLNQDLNGEIQTFGPLSVTLTDNPVNPPPAIPILTSLQKVYPNPFNPVATIAFGLAKAEDTRLEIHNLKGEKVCTIINGRLNSGNYRKTWNGTSDSGRSLPSGIYLVKMTAGKYTSVQKIVMMK